MKHGLRSIGARAEQYAEQLEKQAAIDQVENINRDAARLEVLLRMIEEKLSDDDFVFEGQVEAIIKLVDKAGRLTTRIQELRQPKRLEITIEDRNRLATELMVWLGQAVDDAIRDTFPDPVDQQRFLAAVRARLAERLVGQGNDQFQVPDNRTTLELSG